MEKLFWLNEDEINKKFEEDSWAARYELYEFVREGGHVNYCGRDMYLIKKQEEVIIDSIDRIISHPTQLINSISFKKAIEKVIEDYGEMQYEKGRKDAEQDFIGED